MLPVGKKTRENLSKTNHRYFGTMTLDDVGVKVYDEIII